MIDYSLFSAVAFFVKNADPDLTHQYFSVEERDCNADWKHILSECSKLEADYLVTEENLIVNVEFDKNNKVYHISYQSVADRKSDY